MSVYYGANRKQYHLMDKPITTGGEGSIFSIQSMPGYVAKIYHSVNLALARKISIMVGHPPAPDVANQLAWPLEMLHDASGAFCGFIMKKLDTTNELLELYKYPPREFEGITLKHKLVIAQNICAVIAGVHRAGYVFGDFNPMNIGVNLKTGTVAFFDTDSYHIRDPQTNQVFRCNVCLPGYVAPELIANCKKYKAANPSVKDVYANMPLPTFSVDTDRFALAIHIFKLLMNGYSPFNGIDSKLTVSQASPGLGDVAVDRDNYCFKAGLKPQSVATPPLESLPKYIQDLFHKAFIQGRSNPGKRPSADEWYRALEQYEKELTSCPKNRNHFYFKGLRSCPWCEASDRYDRELSKMSQGPGVRTASPAVIPPPVSVPTTTSTNNYSHTTQTAAASVTAVIQPQTFWQRPEVFWAITLVFSALVSVIALHFLGYSVFDGSGLGNDVMEGIADFLDVIAPYLLFAGGIAGTVFYNVKYAIKNKNCYTGGNYVLSLIMCPVGIAAMFVAILLIALAIYIFLVILVFGIVIGMFSGG